MTAPRITTDKAQELLAGATPGRWVWNMADNGCLTPPDDCSPLSSVAGIVPLGGLARDHYSGSEWNGDRWTWARPADAALIAAAPDLAADLIEARAQIAALIAERDEARLWAEEAAAAENANAAELREARATLDAVAALVDGGDVVERVRELVALEQRLDAVERAGYV